MHQQLERGILLAVLAALLVAIMAAAWLGSARIKQESRAFADAQYVSAGTEAVQ